MSFASELWDQYPLVKQKISDDFHNIKILSDFISKCGKLQSTFGNALLKLTQTHKAGAGEYGTVGTAWESVKSEMERMARINIESLQVAQNNQGDKKAKQKIDKAQKNSTKAENELESATENYNKFEKEYYSESIPKVLTDFEQLEKDRIESIKKTCLDLSGHLKHSYVTKITELSTKMEKCAQAIDVEKDLYSYSSENKTGNKPPQEVVIPYVKPTAKKSTQTKTETSQTNKSQETEKTQTNNNTIEKEVTNEDEKTEYDDEDEGEDVDIEVIALYDYEAKDQIDLAFSAGDSIHVIKKHTSGWWRGEFNGKNGLFPMNFVSATGKPEQTDIQVGDKVRAIYDYEAESSGELTIKEDQTIIITDFDEGWYVGYIDGGDGTEGSFPGNYIEKL